jgi:hypothetical protein
MTIEPPPAASPRLFGKFGHTRPCPHCGRDITLVWRQRGRRILVALVASFVAGVACALVLRSVIG